MTPESPALLIAVLLQAALRALIASLAVWAGLRVLRIGNVMVQKAAWSLVLIASLAMPLAPKWHVLPGWTALRLPDLALSHTAGDGVPVASGASSSPQAAGASFQPSSTEPQPSSTYSLISPAARRSSKAENPTPHTIRRKRAQQSAPEAMLTYALPVASDSGKPAAVVMRAATPDRTSNRTWLIAVLLYLAVAAVLVVRWLAGLFAAMKLWMTAEPVAMQAVSEIPSSVRVRASERISSPVNIGSSILLPADYAGWEDEKLRIVLAHEHAHIRQGDFYLQILAGLYASFFWFSPLGWWLKRKLYELGEAISDRAGLEEAGSRSFYAQLLLEFAALPRPTLTGVAMARTNHLSQRIERLLNESHFRQAFAAGGMRAWCAAVVVPFVVLAATALVRVEAATPSPQISATSGQSNPEQVTEQAPAAPAPPAAAPEPQAAPVPEAAPAPLAPPTPEAMPAPPEGPPVPEVRGLFVQPGQVSGVPLPPGSAVHLQPNGALHLDAVPFADMHQLYALDLDGLPDRLEAESMRLAQSAEVAADVIAAQAQAIADNARCFDQGSDPYAFVDADGKVRGPNFCIFGAGSPMAIGKARQMAHGAFLWFRHDGKEYIVDDPAVVSQIEAMNKPMEELQEQMHGLSKQMRDLGEEQRGLNQKMRETTVPTPDISKEIADLNAAAADLKAKQGGTISQKELSDMQREIGRIQGQLGKLQGEIGARQGELGGQMGKFGSQMGDLGRQMGQLGKKMGEQARENQDKMKGVISDSLSNGKARPVQ